MSGLFAVLLLAATALPAQAQMEDGELPSIDFSVNLMQGAQYIAVDGADDANAGFQRIRAGITANVQFSENVSGLLMVQQEPNDFGGQFAPAIDFAILDLALSDQVTFRAGTPVTGLMNFRGFSDGPVVQGNPLIGNSPADMITAGQGVKLIGAFDSFGFDLTVNRGFGGTLTGFNGENTGVNLIGKFRFTGSEVFNFGAGLATATGNSSLVFAGGDGENYHINPTGSVAPVRNTHAAIPGETIFHGDAKLTAGGADIDGWLGYGTADAPNDNTAASLFGGIGLKYELTESFYGAGRFTYVGNNSDGAGDLDNTSLTRFQIGIGWMVYDKALFKVEYVNQSEGANSLGQIGDDWSGVTGELSFNF